MTTDEEALILSTKKYELEKVAYEQMKQALEAKLKLGEQISDQEQGILDTLELAVASLKEASKGGKN